MSFVHLHVHSQYSFLDGASPFEKLLEKAKNLGMSAVALTDHNRLTGVIRFYEKAKVMGINFDDLSVRMVELAKREGRSQAQRV